MGRLLNRSVFSYVRIQFKIRADIALNVPKVQKVLVHFAFAVANDRSNRQWRRPSFPSDR